MASCIQRVPRGCPSEVAVASGEHGVGFSEGVSYYPQLWIGQHSCQWRKPFFACFRTRRILLITPPQTKALVIIVNKMLGSLVCPIMHVTWALSFSLPDFTAFHSGRKTPVSFCAQDYQTCSYWKDTSFDLSCQNETKI